MLGILAAVAFALAFLMNIFGWGHGHFGWQAVMLLGLTLLAIHLVGAAGPLPWQRRQQLWHSLT